LCVKIFELDGLFVRLRLERDFSGGLAWFWLPPPAPAANLEIPAGQDFTKERFIMRSDLVFGALSHVSNRYQLCQLASKATRKLHKPNTRLQDTTNEVLGRFHTTNPGSAAPVAEPVVQPVERRRAA
jgi:hypothetical protein